jgi:prepilin-type N-terminal cleavage/methylation domain-containing protein
LKPSSKTKARPSRRQTGFTLVELAIVLLIVSILLAAVLVPLSIQMELRRYADTKKTMDQITEALIGFVLANGRLPCPAEPTIADGVANAGVERTACTTAATQAGVLPWVTLNVAETDEWGGRFTYRVSSAFADDPATTTTYACTPSANPTQSSFALCSSGDMKVQSRTTNGNPYNMSSSMLPAVFISHGKNGYGAYRSNGAQIPLTAAGPDETANALPNPLASITATTLTTATSREKVEGASGCTDSPGSMCEFDDLVAFIPLFALLNRMVVAGKLP